MTLLQQIQRGENKKIEFKEKFPDSLKIIKTAIAFSNGAGGKLIIGIKDKINEIVGIKDDEVIELPDRIANIIYDSCYPNIIPEIYITNIEGKNLLVMEIFPGNLKPYYIKSKGKRKGTYIRVGATNKLADEEMLLELERQKRNISFDEEILYDYNLKNADLEDLMKDLSSFLDKEINQRSLLNLKLLKEENGTIYPTRAIAILLGDKELFEYARIKCARFKGNDVGEFIDQKEFTGPLYEQIENAMNFGKIYIKKAGKIEGIQRTDTYEIPMIAVREAIINAVIHRDYSISGSDIKFAIFDDRIEIISPGYLPKTLDIEDIKMGRSEIRNKVLARVFKELRFIEQWGTGIRRILSACKSAGLKEPIFVESGMFVKAGIYKKETRDKVAISSDKVAISSDKFNEKELIILQYVKENGRITNAIARKITGLSSAGVRKVIAKLVNKDFLEAIGERKSRYYILMDRTKE
ncbi:MAG: helix-turn-helix domain-containing protein [Marinisporobacter sp.]|jgi:ATP-dependent DNA helicase RecG|nr:helix-turn-helix domain-containing protein [Marinisporobacter sp.]